MNAYGAGLKFIATESGKLDVYFGSWESENEFYTTFTIEQ